MKRLQFKKPHFKVRKPQLLQVAFLLLGVALIGYGIYGLAKPKIATTGPVVIHEVASEPITESTTEPSEKPISLDSPYVVAPDKPRKITITSAGIVAFIQQVAIDQHGAVAVPNNVNLTGWYTGSVKPGEAGVSIIDGHVYGRYGPAVFTNLHKVQSGDVMTVEFGDGTKHEFSVFASKQVPLSEASSTMLYQEPGVERQLNVITCGGTFDKTTQSYPDRLIVMAKAL